MRLNHHSIGAGPIGHAIKSTCYGLHLYWGRFIGILPGIGANIGSVVAYSAAKNSSKDSRTIRQRQRRRHHCLGSRQQRHRRWSSHSSDCLGDSRQRDRCHPARGTGHSRLATGAVPVREQSADCRRDHGDDAVRECLHVRFLVAVCQTPGGAGVVAPLSFSCPCHSDVLRRGLLCLGKSDVRCLGDAGVWLGRRLDGPLEDSRCSLRHRVCAGDRLPKSISRAGLMESGRQLSALSVTRPISLVVFDCSAFCSSSSGRLAQCAETR